MSPLEAAFQPAISESPDVLSTVHLFNLNVNRDPKRRNTLKFIKRFWPSLICSDQRARQRDNPRGVTGVTAYLKGQGEGRVMTGRPGFQLSLTAKEMAKTGMQYCVGLY